MTTPFNAVLLEGLFYEKGGTFFAEKDTGEHVDVQALLTPLLGTRVQFAVHHLPPQGIQPGIPGAGACRFPGGQGCPVRHDKYPDRLLTYHLDGVLRADPWRQEKFDGTVVPIPFQGMVGHYGRLAVATVIDVEKMRDALGGLNPAAFTTAGLRSQDLEEILARLRKAMEP
jgi:hypothetical protein